MKEYEGRFSEDTSHGHGWRLLADAALPPGVVIDLGCAAGPLAEPVAELGHTYVGADIDRAALDSLASRGFETHHLDLNLGEDELTTAVDAILGGRQLAGVLLLDVLEHLVDPGGALRALAQVASAHEGMHLVVSIPNVTHVDVGIKLLLGRWDLTDVGLLDDTHVRFFNHRLVELTMAGNGWVEVGAHDVVNAFSDQLFPADAPALRPGTPLRQILWHVRMAAEPYGETYQFVRRYAYDPDAARRRTSELKVVDRADEVLLSVVVRANDSRTVDRLLGDLARQTCDDFELLVHHTGDPPTIDPPDELAERVRLVSGGGDGADWRDAAVADARGRYVALLDGRTRLSRHYVWSVRQAVEAMPTRVVQVGLAAAPLAATEGVEDVTDRLDSFEPIDLDPLDLVTGAPFGSVALDAHAIPRHAWAVDGLRFEANGDDAADTLLILQAVEMCGMVRPEGRVAVVHPSVLREVSADIGFVQKHLGSRPLVVPEGAGWQIFALRQAVATTLPEMDALRQDLAAARDQVTALTLYVQHREAEVWGRRRLYRAARRMRRELGSVGRRLKRGQPLPSASSAPADR